uniref:(northern house mosquito) hypothetical protein n=1 Tax=Culex pipiens TaxID=7175 RepID=A0A8D8IWY8_CULPI
MRGLKSIVTVHATTGTHGHRRRRVVPHQSGERGRPVVRLQNVRQHALDLHLPDQIAEEQILEVALRVERPQRGQLHQDRDEPLLGVLPLASLLLVPARRLVIAVLVLFVVLADVLLTPGGHQPAVLGAVILAEAGKYHVLDLRQMLVLDVVLQNVV